jgi:hypothetical protein
LLTKSQYERALKIHTAKEKHLRHLMEAVKKRQRGFKKELEVAKEAGRNKEKRRSERLMAGQKKIVNRLQERIVQLEKGTTPQTEGLEFEGKLLARLRKEFPTDDIQLKGKLVGDVVHIVRYEGKEAGKIIYECKRTPRISGGHARQTYLAKQASHADFGVLVTTGHKRKFSGLMEMGGVLVVAPLGAIPLAHLLRANLVEMLRSKITKAQRAKIAQSLLKYITSPQLKNPIEEVINLSGELQEMVQEEFDHHVRVWNKRLQHYDRIHWDSSQIRANLQRILHGKEPKHILPPRPQVLKAQLQLPAAPASN